MSSLAEGPNETGSPSMSKAEDNLSNSDGPLLKRNLGRNHTSMSLENGSNVMMKGTSSRQFGEGNSTSSLDWMDQKKRYCLWTITCILALTGLCNLLLSITIIDVLRVSRGMESLEVIPEESLVKFFGNTDLDHVCIEKGICQGYGDEPVQLDGDRAGVHVNVKNYRQGHINSDFWLLQNGTSVAHVESFEIKDPDGRSLFSTDFPNFGLPDGVDKIDVKLAETHRIVSPVNETLVLDSREQVSIHGAESLSMEGREVIFMANNDIKMMSNDSIVLEAKTGIFLDINKIPIAPIFKSHLQAESITQFKICVCMPQGKLFKVPLSSTNLNINCAKFDDISPQQDPCL